MKYYSTNGKAPAASLRKAVMRGLAEDRGLYMPERIPVLPREFFENIDRMSFADASFEVARALFGEDVPEDALRRIVSGALSFDTPVVPVDGPIHALELFHGPTLAFKDVGARFMARMLSYFNDSSEPLNVLVATSGDTGSAVANGFLGVEGIRVFVLYPKGKVSPIQECQFTTLGGNITALEVDGVFDDCQALVKSAFMDAELCAHMRLTSANSINVARFLPQSFYYFRAYAQLKAAGLVNGPTDDLPGAGSSELVICVPSGNFGNICSALFAKRMGLPVKRFIAANNANSVFYEFLRDGAYRPRPSVQTLANAMDVGDPSNFARVIDLYSNFSSGVRTDCSSGAGFSVRTGTATTAEAAADPAAWQAVRSDISGATYSDAQIAETIRDVYGRTGYICDPHGACGYRALRDGLRPGETGVFCETAHPAKFYDTVTGILSPAAVTGGRSLTKNLGQCSPAASGHGAAGLEIPERLAAFMKGEKQSVPMSASYSEFREYLMQQ
ncbi:MAG: threonine synthase [Bacteroidales bacterium]|nr:threonine synthase [Bacteroidales bacterium]